MCSNERAEHAVCSNERAELAVCSNERAELAVCSNERAELAVCSNERAELAVCSNQTIEGSSPIRKSAGLLQSGTRTVYKSDSTTVFSNPRAQQSAQIREQIGLLK